MSDQDLKDKIRSDLAGGALTPEQLEAACLEAIKNFGVSGLAYIVSLDDPTYQAYSKFSDVVCRKYTADYIALDPVLWIVYRLL